MAEKRFWKEVRLNRNVNERKLKRKKIVVRLLEVRRFKDVIVLIILYLYDLLIKEVILS